MTRVTLPAYAKLNLTLDILRERGDGYHDLETVMQTVSLHDDVTVAFAAGGGIACRCGDIPGDGTNLAVRAARVFFTETGVAPHGLSINIDKRIPARAGMAGGSADAAAVLRALRLLLAPNIPDKELERVGALVGSDVPFCVRGGAAFAEGRGERLTTLPDAPRFYAVLCKPDFDVSTPELFSRVRGGAALSRPDTAGMLDALRRGDAAGVLARVGNVFEGVLPAERAAEVRAIRERLLSLGAGAAAMTGSGPTVFGLFWDEAAAESAYAALSRDYARTFLARFV